MSHLFKEETKEVDVLEGVDQLIRDTKRINCQWKSSHLLHHIILRLILRLQSMQEEGIAEIIIDSYLQLVEDSSLDDDRTNMYYNFVTKTDPGSLKFK